jgi:GntR family transcriptional repressor for pyruvate dehydrogenase complex
LVYEHVEAVRLYEVVVERLQKLVIDGQLKEGDRLPSESDLARQFGVSRTAIREAIKSLVEQGVVVVRPGSGTYVDRTDQRPLQ